MIKIKKEDTIIDILKKINTDKSEEIKLEFPFGHPVLHNQLSLKIIKNKAKKKKLYIISNDKTARKISKLIGIKFISNKNKIEINNKTTQDILKENYSFIEYTKFEIKKIFQNTKNTINGNIKNNKKVNNIYYIKNKYGKSNKNIILYFILILTLIFLSLLYVYYIAINKTYITIYPETILKTRSQNFTFIEKNKKEEDNIYINNEILINKISKKISISKTIGTSGAKQKKENLSKGKVIFYNYLLEDNYLLKNTTLENKEGIQFYLSEDIIIPSGKNINGKIIPGEKIVTIYGKIKLLNGDYSGEKTNIKKGVLLTIPKLGENKTKIFAKSITNFKGGTNNFTKFLTQKDLDNAKILVENTLKETAIKNIKDKIEQENKQSSLKIQILPIDNIYKFKNLKITIPEHLKLGDEISNFKVHGEIEISTYIYNKQQIISLLKDSINNIIIKDLQKLISIDEKQLRISHIIKRNDLKKINGKYKYIQNLDTNLKVKATTQIEYIITQKFNNPNSNFIKQIKQSILGKNIEEAEKILTNKSEINNVKIEIKPFFIKNISKLPENIEIIINK